MADKSTTPITTPIVLPPTEPKRTPMIIGTSNDSVMAPPPVFPSAS